VPYNLILIRLILISLNEIPGAGKRNLVDILFNLVRTHANTVVRKAYAPLLRAYLHPNLIALLLRCLIFPDQCKLF